MNAPTFETATTKDLGRGRNQTEKKSDNAGAWGQGSGLLATMRKVGILEGDVTTRTDHNESGNVEEQRDKQQLLQARAETVPEIDKLLLTVCCCRNC